MTPMLFFLFFIPLLGIILLSVNFILAPHKPYKEKKTPFECGYHSFLSQNRTQFTVVFFIFSILFLLFDLEIVIIYPYVVSSSENQISGLIAMIVFTLLITVGFIYELGKGALKIKSKQEYILAQGDASKSLYKGRYNTTSKLSKFRFFYIGVLVKDLSSLSKNILCKESFFLSPLYVLYCTAKKASKFEVLKAILVMLYSSFSFLGIKCPNFLIKSPLFPYFFAFYINLKILFDISVKNYPLLFLLCTCFLFYEFHSPFSTISLLYMLIFSALGKLFLQFWGSRLKNKFPFVYNVLIYTFDIIFFVAVMLLIINIFGNLIKHIKDYIFRMQKGSTGGSSNSGGSGNNNPNPSGGNPGPSGGNPGPWGNPGPSGGNPGPSGGNPGPSEDEDSLFVGDYESEKDNRRKRKYREILPKELPPTQFPPTEESSTEEPSGRWVIKRWSDVLEEQYDAQKGEINMQWDSYIWLCKQNREALQQIFGVYSTEAKDAGKILAAARREKKDKLIEAHVNNALWRKYYYTNDRKNF